MSYAQFLNEYTLPVIGATIWVLFYNFALNEYDFDVSEVIKEIFLLSLLNGVLFYIFKTMKLPSIKAVNSVKSETVLSAPPVDLFTIPRSK